MVEHYLSDPTVKIQDNTKEDRRDSLRDFERFLKDNIFPDFGGEVPFLLATPTEIREYYNYLNEQRERTRKDETTETYFLSPSTIRKRL